MDQYLKILNEVCENLEKVYGVSLVSETEKALLDENIEVVLEEVNQQIKEIGDRGVTQRNSEAFDHLSLLAHIMYRIEFFDYRKISFHEYPHIDRLEEALKRFSNRNTMNKETIKYVNLIVSLLNLIDRKHVNLRFELPYRLLRVFTILVLYSNYAEASILANFLLRQLRRGSYRAD